jgi:hypothetical protein
MYTDNCHFYITMFSTASQTLYPENTLGAFTVELEQSIEFDPNDKWEVGLCEISCPQNYTRGSENAIFYCELIPAHLVGSSLARCLRTFIYRTTHGQFAFKSFIICPYRRGQSRTLESKLCGCRAIVSNSDIARRHRKWFCTFDAYKYI